MHVGMCVCTDWFADGAASNIKDPKREDVKFHGDSESKVQRYRFNTKDKDQMFCGKCGASLGIDFRDFYKPKFDGFGISVSLLPEGRFARRRVRERECVCAFVFVQVVAELANEVEPHL